MMASKRGEFTTSAAAISRSQDEVHSSNCGFEDAFAAHGQPVLSPTKVSLSPDDWEYRVKRLKTFGALSSSSSLVLSDSSSSCCCNDALDTDVSRAKSRRNGPNRGR